MTEPTEEGVRKLIEEVQIPPPIFDADDKEKTVDFFSQLENLIQPLSDQDSLKGLVGVCHRMNKAELRERIYQWRIHMHDYLQEPVYTAANTILDALEIFGHLPDMLKYHTGEQSESMFETVRENIQSLFVPGFDREDPWIRDQVAEKIESLVRVMEDVPRWDKQRVRNMMVELNLAQKLEQLKAEAKYEGQLVAEVQSLSSAYEKLIK